MLRRLWQSWRAKNRKLAILVDYENVAKAGVLDGKILDLDAVVRQCAELGDIIFAFLFIPDFYFRRPDFDKYARDVFHMGFYPVPCPSGDPPNGNGSRKEKDRVDVRMRALGDELLEHGGITDLVIISGDGDFAPLAQHARFHRKRVVLFSGQKTAVFLRQVVDIQYPLPMVKK